MSLSTKRTQPPRSLMLVTLLALKPLALVNVCDVGHPAHGKRIDSIDSSNAYQALQASESAARGLLRRVVDILCKFLVEKRDLLDVVNVLHRKTE